MAVTAHRAPLAIRRPPAPHLGKPAATLTDFYADEPFPRPRVQWAPGADLTAAPSTWAWVDITDSVRADDGITIKRGKGDAASGAEPARLRFTVNDPDGDFIAYNPYGQNWPNVKLNTPIRVFANDGTADYLRGVFYADGFTPQWDTTFNLQTVTIEASGLLRRLAQGTPPLKSLLYVYNLLEPVPVAYWPCEDEDGATSFAEAMGTSGPMTWEGAAPDLASSSGPDGSLPLPKLTNGSGSVLSTILVGDVANYTASTDWTVAFVCNVAGTTTLDTPLVHILTDGTLFEWRLTLYPNAGTDQIGIEAWSGSGAGTKVIDNKANFTIGGVAEPFGTDLFVQIQGYQSGGSIAYECVITDVVTQSQLTLTGSVAGTNGNVTSVQVRSWDHGNWVYGHFAVYDYLLTYPTDLAGGRAGQYAAQRIAQVCDYAGDVPVTITGTTADSALMGSWTTSTLIDTLRECEAADGGLLYDGLDGRLQYLIRRERYNVATSLTLDMDAGQVAPPFRPTFSDLRTRNSWRVTRTGGSSGRSVDATGVLGTSEIGTYDDSATVNVYADDVLPDQAGWRVAMGTVVGYRYSALSFDLQRNRGLIASWVAMDIGARIDVTNQPTALPGPIELILDGYTETLRPKVWRVDANCSPYSPWRVFTVTSSTLGRIQASSSTVAADAAAGATSVSVAGTRLWSTAAGDYPQSIDLDGLQVTVSAVTGASSPQTFTTAALPRAVRQGADVKVWRAAHIGL